MLGDQAPTDRAPLRVLGLEWRVPVAEAEDDDEYEYVTDTSEEEEEDEDGVEYEEEEYEDEDDEEEDDEEPRLKYQRLGASVADILRVSKGRDPGEADQ